MSARTIRRAFASPFVITLAAPLVAVAACGGGGSKGPIYANPGPPQREPAPVADPVSTTDPAMLNDERHWTVMRQGDTCQVFENVTCPAQATCNPPPPRPYACTADVTPSAPMKIMRPAGQAECMVERAMPSCPPGTMCNPPPPQKVACPP
jgi:hypothetical protein